VNNDLGRAAVRSAYRASQYRGTLLRLAHQLGETEPIPDPTGTPDGLADLEAWANRLLCAIVRMQHGQPLAPPIQRRHARGWGDRGDEDRT
jgi:hypothetical protein